jgi:DNA-binding transcriptional MerR regulator
MPNYTVEEIEEARRLHIDEGFSIRKTAEALGIKAHCTVSGWKVKYKWKKTAATYPVNSLKAQLTRVTKLVDTLEPKLDEIGIINPSKEQKEILANYRRFSELQLKLIKQLGLLDPAGKKPPKKSIFE